MGTFELIAELPLSIEGYGLQGLSAEVSSGFERLTTLVRLRGLGHEGIGEDVVYEAEDQRAMQDAGAVLDLTGRYTLGEFCALIDSLDLFPVAPAREVSRNYRRWTFQSAALDLALRQAGIALHEALGREPAPLRFVVSLRLGEPASIQPLTRLLAREAHLRFKLDPTSSWTPELLAQISATRAVEVLDFKSFYHGTIVDQPSDPALYERVLAALPEAWIEDPDIVDRQIAALLAPHLDGVTWDAPIHGVADIEALDHRPQMINIKPSRIGGLGELCATYDHCLANRIGAYGGGQFELGPGRGQAQYLACLFHPDGPNDLAPAAYNAPEPPGGLPGSPLTLPLAPVGFALA